MTPEDREKTIKLLSVSKAIFPESKLTSEGLALYIPVLDPLTYDQVSMAMKALLRKAVFFPKPAEIINQAMKLHAQMTHSEKPDPGEAWGEAVRFSRAVGPYCRNQRFNWSCPEVERAVDIFGRKALWELPSDGVNTARAQFMKIYSSIIDGSHDRQINDTVVVQIRGGVKALIDSTAAAHAMPKK